MGDDGVVIDKALFLSRLAALHVALKVCGPPCQFCAARAAQRRWRSARIDACSHGEQLRAPALFFTHADYCCCCYRCSGD